MQSLICRLHPLRIDKDSSVREPRTSNKWHREAGEQDQPTDRLLPDNDTRVWMAGEGKIPCEVQRG